MKKVTSQVNFTFKYDGNTTLELSPDGVICTDAVANALKSRYHGIISVFDVDPIEEAEMLIASVEAEVVAETAEAGAESTDEDTEVVDLADEAEVVAETKKAKKAK